MVVVLIDFEVPLNRTFPGSPTFENVKILGIHPKYPPILSPLFLSVVFPFFDIHPFLHQMTTVPHRADPTPSGNDPGNGC